MTNTTYWEEKFQAFTNTAEERSDLFYEAFHCYGDFKSQEAFCETADVYGYFNNVDFVLDMMNTVGNWLCQSDSDDFVCNYGLLGDIDFVFENIFNLNFDSDNCYGHNYIVYMIQAFGLRNCIEKDPKKFLHVLENAYRGYGGDLCDYFIEEPEAFSADIPDALKDTYSKLFKEIKAECEERI